jgi:hypothetical protein
MKPATLWVIVASLTKNSTQWGMTMQRILFLTLAASLLFTIQTRAEESNAMWESRVVIAEHDGAGGEPIRIDLSGEELGFNLQDLQFGESRSVVDSSGRSILITRTEKGYDFEVDGRIMSMPVFEHHAELVEIVDPAEGEFDVHMNSGMTFTAAVPAGITIITPGPLDENTQTSIRSVLQSAGHDEAVTFVDQSTMPPMHSAGAHAIKVIQKDVHVSEQRAE